MSKSHLFLGAANSSSVTISLVGVPSAQGAIVNYITLPGNLPKTNGNHIYVWQTTDNIIPWNKTPDGDTAVSTDSSTSTQQVTFAVRTEGLYYWLWRGSHSECRVLHYLHARQPADQSPCMAVWLS